MGREELGPDDSEIAKWNRQRYGNYGPDGRTRERQGRSDERLFERFDQTVDGLQTLVSRHRRGEDVWEWEIRMTCPSLPAGFSVGAESALSLAGQWFTGGDLQTGDDDFDRAIHLQGEPTVLASLHSKNRRRITRLVAEGGLIGGGGLTVDLQSRSSEVPRKALRRYSHLLKSIAGKQKLLGRCASIIREDPIRGVRARLLILLCELQGERVQAALAVGVLMDLQTPDRWVSKLLAVLPPQIVGEVAGLLDAPALLRASKCVATGALAVPWIAGLSTRGRHVDLPHLLSLRDGWLIHADVKKAASEAIAGINARLGAPSEGGVSLVEPVGGAVSVADAASGQVSMGRKHPKG
jgi:hypothetical protein